MPLDTTTSFGQWVKQRRKELDLTQAALSEQAGCAIDTLRRIESGRLRPSRQLAELLAEALEVPTEEQAGFVHWARRHLPAERPPHAAPEPSESGFTHPPTNIPSPLTPFVGRERELERVRSLLWRADVRLVTLTGPPGIGKTRLSMEVAASLLDDYGDGVFFVPLAAITDPDLVVPTIARTLGVREAPGKSTLEGLKEHLKSKRLLLVLDNLEQVMGAALALVDLLTTCPQVKALVTSREALRVRGEKAMPVPAMELPSPEFRVPSDGDVLGARHASPLLDALREVESVALFLQRTEDVNLDFALTPANASTVAAICRRMEGLPLAIELAASRMDILSPQDLLDRLESHSMLSAGGARDLPPHQRTLRDAINWSHDLLSQDDRQVFRRAAAFSGGFSLEAAEAVCKAQHDEKATVLTNIASLTAKSLLQRADVGDTFRFSILEAIQEYGVEQLEERAEAEDTRRRHAHYFLALAEEAASQLRGQRQHEWLDRLETEHDNLRAALRWARKMGDASLEMRLSLALTRFWELHDHFGEGYEQLKALVAILDRFKPLDQATILAAAGLFAYMLDHDNSRKLLERSAELARMFSNEVAGKRTLSGALRGLDVLAYSEGDLATSRKYAEERVEIWRQMDDPAELASALSGLAATVMCQGDNKVARHLCLESLGVNRAMGDKTGTASVLINLGNLCKAEGDYSQAREYATEALEKWRELGHNTGVALSLALLGTSAFAEGKLEEAYPYLSESIVLSPNPRHSSAVAICLGGLSEIWRARGELVRAARLIGATEGHGRIERDFDRHMRAAFERTKVAVQAQLGDAAFRQAWAEGQAMPIEDAIRYATGQE